RGEAALTHPVVHKLLDTATGQCGTRERVNLVFLVLGIGADPTFNQTDLGFGRIVTVEFLTYPLLLPARVIDFTTQARSFRVRVETQTFDGVEVAFKGNEAVQGRPQAVAVNRKHHTNQLAVLAQGVDLCNVRTTLDTSFVFRGRDVGGHRRI